MSEVIKVDKVGSRYIARASFAQKEIPKAAGFRWDPIQRYWWTGDAEKAASVSDPEAAARLMAQAEEKKQQKAVAVEASRASDADVDLPCPDGIAYLPYQRAGIMIRRLKADVLTELPAKRRAIVEFPSNGATDAVEEESEAWERSEEEINALRVRLELAKAGSKEEYETTVLLLREATQAAFAEISKLRHATALATVPYAVDHILTALGDEGHKIVVMAHHKDVIALIMSALAEAKIGAVSLTGDTPMQTRQDNVDYFQTNPECRVFVGNILAAGVGITLTAAAHVVFAELDWVPGNMTQAEDRCHRIGQTDSVLVQHLVLEGSLSARMAKVLIDKQEVIDRALDRVVAAADEAPATPAKERAATESLTRSKLDELAQKLTPANIAAIHAGLKILTGFDADHAQEQNGIGYSKMDVQIGHSLARSYSLTARQAALGSKLITKYRRQLPDEIVQETKPTE